MNILHIWVWSDMRMYLWGVWSACCSVHEECLSWSKDLWCLHDVIKLETLIIVSPIVCGVLESNLPQSKPVTMREIRKNTCIYYFFEVQVSWGLPDSLGNYIHFLNRYNALNLHFQVPNKRWRKKNFPGFFSLYKKPVRMRMHNSCHQSIVEEIY